MKCGPRWSAALASCLTSCRPTRDERAHPHLQWPSRPSLRVNRCAERWLAAQLDMGSHFYVSKTRGAFGTPLAAKQPMASHARKLEKRKR